jgi:hypothetical protein
VWTVRDKKRERVCKKKKVVQGGRGSYAQYETGKDAVVYTV